MFQLVVALRRRLIRKIVALAPIIAGALLLASLLSVVLYVIDPYLPVTYQHLLEHARQGNWPASRASVLSILDSYGDASSTIFVLVQILQVLLAPIPGPLLGLLGGSLFGFWRGLVLSMLGLAIGSAIAMGSSRLLGDAVVRRFVPSRLLNRFDRLAGANGLWSFFLVFLLPAFPDDAICFMAGLTRFPLHRLLLVCILGRLPGTAVLAFVGAGVGGSTISAYLVLGVAMVLAFGLWLFSEEIESLVARIGVNQHRTTGS